MTITLDKFWQFLREWSVGKIIVTLSFLVILIKDCGTYPDFIKYMIFVGVFHELFDFCNNNLTQKDKKNVSKLQALAFNFFMLISLASIITIALKLLWF